MYAYIRCSSHHFLQLHQIVTCWVMKMSTAQSDNRQSTCCRATSLNIILLQIHFLNSEQVLFNSLYLDSAITIKICHLVFLQYVALNRNKNCKKCIMHSTTKAAANHLWLTMTTLTVNVSAVSQKAKRFPAGSLVSLLLLVQPALKMALNEGM